MHKRNTASQGFTIVELLIVVVVVSILAAISTVAYTNIQNKARNTKTITAVSQWARALKIYHLDHGTWPGTSCLGDIGSYDSDGRCWSGLEVTVNPITTELLKTYTGGVIPIPDTTPVSANAGTSIRGGRFQGSTHSIYYVLHGTSDCPKIAHLSQTYHATYSNGVQCGGEIR